MITPKIFVSEKSRISTLCTNTLWAYLVILNRQIIFLPTISPFNSSTKYNSLSDTTVTIGFASRSESKSWLVPPFLLLPRRNLNRDAALCTIMYVVRWGGFCKTSLARSKVNSISWSLYVCKDTTTCDYIFNVSKNYY